MKTYVIVSSGDRGSEGTFSVVDVDGVSSTQTNVGEEKGGQVDFSTLEDWVDCPCAVGGSVLGSAA